MNVISRSQKILMKFFQNKSHKRSFNKNKTLKTKKNNFSKTVTDNTNTSNNKFGISFEELNIDSHDDDSKNSQENKVDNRPTFELIRRCFTSDMDPPKSPKKKNSDGKNSASKIMLLSIHKNTNFSKISDSQTPSFGLESSYHSLRDKRKSTKNTFFRSFGSHISKKSKFISDQPNDPPNRSILIYFNNFYNNFR
jgi:hypothetical protein